MTVSACRYHADNESASLTSLKNATKIIAEVSLSFFPLCSLGVRDDIALCVGDCDHGALNAARENGKQGWDLVRVGA
jgi:hypothetical protein